MALDIRVLEALVTNGATAATLLAVLKAQLEPSKAAVRQRRYRQRRNAVTVSITRDAQNITRDVAVEGKQQLSKGSDRNGVTVGDSSSLSFFSKNLSSSVDSLSRTDSLPRARAREPCWPFAEFWQRYPNKVGKQAAEKSFDRVRKSGKVTFTDLMKGLEAYRRKRDDRPWCNPATWLNQGRWEDQPPLNPNDDWRSAIPFFGGSG